MDNSVQKLKELLYSYESLDSNFIENVLSSYKGYLISNCLTTHKLTYEDLFIIEDSLDCIKVVQGFDMNGVIANMMIYGRERSKGGSILKLAFVEKSIFSKLINDNELQPKTKVMMSQCRILPTDMNFGKYDILGIFESKFKMTGIENLAMLGKIIQEQ